MEEEEKEKKEEEDEENGDEEEEEDEVEAEAEVEVEAVSVVIGSTDSFSIGLARATLGNNSAMDDKNVDNDGNVMMGDNINKDDCNGTMDDDFDDNDGENGNGQQS